MEQHLERGGAQLSQFRVENRPGAGTNIGTEAVVRAPADGYTLLMVGGYNAINTTLYDKLDHNFIRDIAPVAGIIVVPNVMVVNPSVPAATVPEFIAYAKSKQGKTTMLGSLFSLDVYGRQPMIGALNERKRRHARFGSGHGLMSAPSSYETLPHWRAIYRALPQYLQNIAEPWPVKEEWLRIGRFDIHLDRWPGEQPRARMVLVHGGGGHGRLLAIYGAMCQRLGLEAVAPDMPGYGLTRMKNKRAVTYDDWRAALSGVLMAEAASGLPVLVFGLSMGGMLAYDATARTGVPAGLIVTCLLDARDRDVQRGMLRWQWLAPLAVPSLSFAKGITDSMPILMRLGGNMKAITNDPALTRAIIADPRAGGNWMPGRFLRTFLTAAPEVEPEAFDVCPVLLAHPAADTWTNISISEPVFRRLRRVEKRLVMLDDGGHFPVEKRAHQLLVSSISMFVDQVLLGAGRSQHPR
jgi:alpha-beta hydrolase superfamily lysophospholipase